MNQKIYPAVRYLVKLFVTLLIVSAPHQSFSQQKWKLEDMSPASGSTPGDPMGRSPWGKMLTISATGLEGAVGPATSWSTSNNGVIVDHVAAADKDGHLIVFFSYPGSDWKAVSVMEKTNATIAEMRPESWVFHDGSAVLERIAAPSPSGDLLLFTWHSGSDWIVTNLTAATQKKIMGPVTSWQAPLGDRMVEHIGARGIDNHFLVFWRVAGGEWSVIDVTNRTGREVGDSGTSWARNIGSEWAESVAMPDPTGDLILFTYRPSTDWQAENLSESNRQKVGGPPVHWSATVGLQREYFAAPAPNGDLVLFYEGLVDHSWGVLNISKKTGHSVMGPVTNWNVQGEDGTWWEHLAGRGPNGHLYVFFRPIDGTWQVKDVTNTTNQTITQTPTSWTTAKGFYSGENLAAPSWDGRLHVFTFNPVTDWKTTDVSLRASGRIVYAASEMAGVWRSRDYGMNWEQMTRPQDPGEIEGGLDAHVVLDVVVSPTDPNLVLAATGRDHRNPSHTGIYRSTDGGASWERVYGFECGGEVQPATQIIFAPGDPKTVYAAGGCALAISNKQGAKASWDESAPKEVAEGRRVWHLAVSPELPGELRRGYACGDDNFWYFSHSTISGQNSAKRNWKWVHDDATATALPKGFCGETSTGQGVAAQLLAVEPGDPNHVYLAIDHHANGPSYFHPKDGGPEGVHVNIPVVYDDGNVKGEYDSGDTIIWRQENLPPWPKEHAILTHDPHLRFVDTPPCSGRHWESGKKVVYDPNDEKQFSGHEQHVLPDLLPGENPPKVGASLCDDLTIKFVDTVPPGGPLGPRGAGEGSLWYGDFSGFDPKHADSLKGKWENLPGPPVYYGNSTISGGAYVFTHATDVGYLVLFSNKESVHMANGKPVAGGWHRLGARDASETKREGKTKDQSANLHYIHVDPHGLAISPDFRLDLIRSDQQPPYDQNMEIDHRLPPPIANIPMRRTCYGRIWLSNDGGIYVSDDCGQQWVPAQSGLSTLASHNIAGVTQVSKEKGKPNKPPALYFGTSDNDDFFSLDGGKSWRWAKGNCGDCDVWYSDPAQPNRIWRHPPRDSGKHAFTLFVSENGAPEPSAPFTVDFPDPPSGSEWKPGGDNSAFAAGSRPIVQTIAGEAPLSNGDYITIQEIIPPQGAAPYRKLLRARDSVGSASAWAQVGPNLPSADVFIAQASGGHAATVFYVGNGYQLWRWPRNDDSTAFEWQQVAPGGGALGATRFFVNPYSSKDIYILDPTNTVDHPNGTVYHSWNGGKNWYPDPPLDMFLTNGGTFLRQCGAAGIEDNTLCILNDMIFDRNSPKIRFALGLAGVFYSGDSGNFWWRLVDTRALPSRPRGAFFDPITDPKDPSLYIAFQGRGIMRLHPVPTWLP